VPELDPHSIGARIREAREAVGLTHTQLARRNNLAFAARTGQPWDNEEEDTYSGRRIRRVERMSAAEFDVEFGRSGAEFDACMRWLHRLIDLASLGGPMPDEQLLAAIEARDAAIRDRGRLEDRVSGRGLADRIWNGPEPRGELAAAVEILTVWLREEE
jgi:transcriptional regulator with XRE-family HTH domain